MRELRSRQMKTENILGGGGEALGKRRNPVPLPFESAVHIAGDLNLDMKLFSVSAERVSRYFILYKLPQGIFFAFSVLFKASRRTICG